MKLLIIALSIFISMPCLAASKATIVRVIDGDTVKIKHNNKEKSLRLHGIDCFETRRIYKAREQSEQFNINLEEVIKRGKATKKYVTEILPTGAEVEVSFIEKGKYWRPVGIIHLDENQTLGEKLIEKGFCKVYKKYISKNSSYYKKLMKAQKKTQ